MTLEEFVAGIRSGEIAVRQGGMTEEGDAYSADGPAKGLDAESIAAEAFARDILDADVEWDDAVAQVKAL